MYLPRNLISHLYIHLQRTHHALSPPVLILTALEPDALCACRILTALLKRDYIPHKIQPVSGYADLSRAGEELIRPMRTSEGGSGGVVVCMGVGGLVDLGDILGLDNEDEVDMGGIEVWVIDARRPWSLGNVFGGKPSQQALAEADGNARHRIEVEKGKIQASYKPGKGGIVVFDDGDIDEELGPQREAYCALLDMPTVDDEDLEDDASESGDDGDEDRTTETARSSKKRKSSSDPEDEDGDEENEPPRRRRRSNSVSRGHLWT